MEAELKELKYSEYPEYKEFVKTFVQRQPRYAVKLKGKTWRTKKKPLFDTPITSHLEGKYYIGVLAKWYPGFCVLDMDDVDLNDVERVRDSLKLDITNSMLCSSESPGSYHILFKPSYNTKPPTVRLLQGILKPFGQQNNIEIYPQPNRAIRLPFGSQQDCLDFEYIHLKDWKEKLYWFNKLDDLDLKTIPYHQLELDLYIPKQKSGSYQIGRELFETGLNAYNSRNDAQFYILYYLWRRNIPPETALDMCYNIIKTKHNGYSEEVNSGNWGTIKEEIKRQARTIYSTYEHSNIYPDEIHNNFNGYITKADIKDIVILCNANMPRMKFLYNLVKYCYPRRYRTFIDIHSDRLKEWSSRTNYLRYLEEFRGILKRGEIYQVDKFSKSIKLNWNYKDTEAILIEDRAPDTFEETIRISYKPQEFRELLIRAGSEYKKALITTGRLYKR